MPDHRSGVVDADGHPLYYEATGDGPALVLCHGAGGNHSIWFRQVAAFSEDYRVITWDQRGFGRSRGAPGAGDPKVAVRDLAALFDALELERAHVVAQSMGGWAGLGYTLEHEGRVATLTLTDTVGGITSPVIEQNWRETPARLQARAGPGDHSALGRRFVRDDPAGTALYLAIGSVNDRLGPETLRGLLGLTWPSGALAALTVPTTFVVGEDDEIFPPAVIRDAAAAIPGATVEVIPGAGHSPYFEDPERWNEVVGRALAPG
jgi:3-oxoadipate enol-lactonase